MLICWFVVADLYRHGPIVPPDAEAGNRISPQ